MAKIRLSFDELVSYDYKKLNRNIIDSFDSVIDRKGINVARYIESSLPIVLWCSRYIRKLRSKDQGFKVSLFFRWYDLWIGAYVDKKEHTLYICPLPTMGIKIKWR